MGSYSKDSEDVSFAIWRSFVVSPGCRKLASNLLQFLQSIEILRKNVLLYESILLHFGFVINSNARYR